MKKKMTWEKWIDPLNSNLSTVEWPGYEDEENKIHSIDRSDRVVLTKLGAFTLNDSSLASRHFDIWIINTNFPITDSIGQKIVKSEGVSWFLPLTRYSAQVGFPTSGLFDITECKLKLQNTLIMEDKVPLDFGMNDILDEETKKEISEKIEKLNSEDVLWCMYITPNGNIETVQAKCVNEEFTNNVNLLREVHTLIGGYIYTNIK